MKTQFAVRLAEFIHYTRKKDIDFAKSIDVTKANLYNYLHSTEDKKLGTPHIDVLKRLFEAYPMLNAYWLICGTGEMLNEDGSIVNDGQEKYVKLCKECENKQNAINQLSDYNSLLKENLHSCRLELQKFKTEPKREKRKAG